MDIIQKRLEIIDKKLATNLEYIHNQLIYKTPLVFITVGLIIGITLQNYLPMPVLIWLIILAISSLPAAITFFLYKSTSSKYIIAYTALLCFICLGAIRLAGFHKLKSNDITNLIGSEKSLATIKGIIITEPYINRHTDWKFARFKFNDPATSFYLKVTDAQTTKGWEKTSGTVRVQVEEPIIDLKAGDHIRFYCWLERFYPSTNPGQFDSKKYFARKNIYIAASVKSRNAIKLLKNHPKGTFIRIKRALRQKTSQTLLSDLSAHDSSRALLEALLLGYRRNIDSETYQAFRKTGLLHFISLSGMHFGILIAIVWWLCKTAGLLKRPRSIICIITAIIFLLIIPPRAPALRAAVITIIFCLSLLFRRTPNPFNSLSLAAIILLLFTPTQLFEAGFQLSFVTVLGILLFTERIYFFLYEKINHFINFNEISDKSPSFRTMAKILTYILKLFSVGLAAWLCGAGILLYHFHTITPLASLWTVIAFPFVALILTVGFLKILISLLLPTLGTFLASIVTLLSPLLIELVERMAEINISEILIGHISIAFIVIYYLIIIFIGFFHLKQQMLKRAISTTLILTLLIFLSAAKYSRTHRHNLILTCLDVGHGQAILAQIPGKKNILFDAGSLYKSDPGRRTILPFLNFAGVNKIDAILISHNDVDHINAIPEIAEHCDVNGVYANDAFFMAARAEPNGTAGTLKTSPNKQGLRKIQRLSKDLNLGSKTKIRILWPSEQICRNEELSDNDKSMVCLIEFAGRKILLCSDIEKFTQNRLLQIYPDLKADIVIVPHHGLANTLDLNFIKKINPSILISSCSQTQYEKNPLKSINGKKFYTARDGAITISINAGGQIEHSPFLKQKAASAD